MSPSHLQMLYETVSSASPREIEKLLKAELKSDQDQLLKAKMDDDRHGRKYNTYGSELSGAEGPMENKWRHIAELLRDRGKKEIESKKVAALEWTNRFLTVMQDTMKQVDPNLDIVKMAEKQQKKTQSEIAAATAPSFKDKVKNLFKKSEAPTPPPAKKSSVLSAAGASAMQQSAARGSIQTKPGAVQKPADLKAMEERRQQRAQTEQQRQHPEQPSRTFGKR